MVDSGSRHGTFLNAQPLVDRQTLKPGDEIRLGSLNGPSLRFGPARESTSTIHKLVGRAACDFDTHLGPGEAELVPELRRNG